MVHDLPFAGLRFTTAPSFFYWNRDFRWSPAPLPDFDLWCIIEGRGRVSLREQTIDLVPGICFVLRPGDHPVAWHDPAHPLTAFYCHFLPLDRRGRRIPADRIALPPPGLPLRDLHWFESLARRCVNASARNDALGLRQSRLALEQMLAQVWEWWQTPPPLPGDEALAKVLREIQRSPGRPWHVGTMARDAGLSRSQFTRRFCALAGRSPKAFVVETRLDLARQLVLETTLSLTQIAIDLGYPDLYLFSRQFRRRFDQAPSRLRALGQASAPTAAAAGRQEHRHQAAAEA